MERDPVEATFRDIDNLAQRYYTGAVLRWREYREGVFAAIRAALSPEAPKPAEAATCAQRDCGDVTTIGIWCAHHGRNPGGTGRR